MRGGAMAGATVSGSRASAETLAAFLCRVIIKTPRDVIHLYSHLETAENEAEKLILRKMLMQPGIPHPTECPLTPRQRQCVEGLARGKTYQQIALELGISPSVVRTHLIRTYEKLDVRDRAQVVIKCYQEGWIL